MNYIYALLCPETNACRYIGKSKNPQARLKFHKCDMRGNTHKIRWVRSLQRRGLSPDMVVLEHVPLSESWQDAECFWIEYFRFLGAKLTNATKGGDGLSDPSMETRRKMGAASIGKKMPEHHKLRLIALNTGRAWSDESKAKLSATKKARYADRLANGNPYVVSDERKMALSLKSKGRAFTEEHRAKLSRSKTGQRHSDETRKKISEIQMGKVLTPEHRAKISESNKGKKMSVEAIAKRVESRKKHPHVYTEEERQAMSIRSKGRKHSDEHKAKSSASLRETFRRQKEEGTYKKKVGHKMSEETKQKLSAANKGRVITPEAREKMRLAKLGKPSPLKGAKLTEEQKAARLQKLREKE